MSFDWSEHQHINFGAKRSSGPALDRALALSRFNEAAKKGAPVAAAEQPAVIYPQIHVLSADKGTRNKTRYPTEAHKGSRAQRTGQHSFTKPYPIPMIRDHQASPSECGGEASPIYGRFIDAKLVKNSENGQGHVAGLAEVPHPDAIFEIMTGLWLTGSLGSSVHLAQCSICGEAFMSPGAMADHSHQRGGFYRAQKPAKPTSRPAAPQEQGPLGENQDYVQCDAKEHGATECLTDIMSYSAREYSRVVVPSDDESVIDVIDTTASASHFTTAPAAEAADEPVSALWVPMSASSRANVSAWGERYIDLVTGIEKSASDLGLMFGHQLHEHYEHLLSTEDADVAFETINISRQAHVPYNFSGLTVESAEESTLSQPAVTENLDESAHTPAVDKTVLAETQYANTARKSYKPRLEEGSDNLHIPNKAHYEAALRSLDNYHGTNKVMRRATILKIGRANGWS